MYIKTIDIKKFRHLQNIKIGPLPPPSKTSDLIVLAGANGSGKSSILELISMAMSQAWSLKYQVNRTQPDSSFEITFGLHDDEVDILNKNLGGASPLISVKDETKRHINDRKEYCRSFKYEEGEYSRNPNLHNECHNAVIEILRKNHQRPLGFYVGADRSYGKQSFQRDELFNYDKKTSTNHVWSVAFRPPLVQYEDMFSYLINWRYHYIRRLGTYHQNAPLGKESGLGPPKDEYGEILELVFPNYKFIDTDQDSPSDLLVTVPSSEDPIPFSDLSSGEKEVFFLLSFFQRHKIHHAIAIVDEPELHLHPSLARVLIRSMLRVKPFNQVWLASQSSEVIDEAGRDKTYFLRDQEGQVSVVLSRDEDSHLECIRDFFGYSGYIGLARAFVFSEGTNASVDRKMMSKLFRPSSNEIKVVPSSSSDDIGRVNKAVLNLIENDLAYGKFFAIRDRDYLEQGDVDALKQKSNGKLFVLERHEIENYLIDYRLISKVCNEIFSLTETEESVRLAFENCVSDMAGNVLRDMFAYRLNRRFMPQDFSVKKFMDGQLNLDEESKKFVDDKLEQMKSHLVKESDQTIAALCESNKAEALGALFESCKTEVEQSVLDGSWIKTFPGKELIECFCKSKGIPKSPTLQNSIIRELQGDLTTIDLDLKNIIDSIDNQC